MGKFKVHDIQGKEVGEVDFADDILVTNKGQQAVHEVVVATLAGRRAGSASTLHKGEVAGSNAKPWKQKGLGRARAGYKQSNVWRGGYAAFGPKPRSYGKKVNKKTLKLAFKRAFSDVITENRLKVIDELTVADGKTKTFVEIMKKLETTAPALFVVDKLEEKSLLAARNIQKVEVESANNVSVYQLVRFKNVVVTKSAMDAIKARFDEKSPAKKAEAEVVEKG
ncbi:50S ribosomal protein L4 [bacterium E08(2017)]|nr:50S ribosomal protein L4 [bacterium E08(2017)]